MPNFKILKYEYVPDILQRRDPYRGDHLAAARAMEAEGKLVLAGAFGDPVEGGMFIFKNVTEQEIEAYIAADSYVKNDLVVSWSIQPIAVVVGGQ